MFAGLTPVLGLLEGKNFGEQIIRVAADPTG